MSISETIPGHLTLRDYAHRELVAMIVSGQLTMGDAIEERVMLERLNVSRTPFREAISTLEKQGLVEIRRYRGCSVRFFDAAEVDDLYQLRKVLEGFAIRLAAERITPAELADCGAILDRGIAALERSDMPAYGQHDKAFHDKIATIARNHALIDALGRIALQIQMCRVVANKRAGFVTHAALERDAILEALRNRDGLTAERLMHEHIESARVAVMEWIAHPKVR
jgi:DNA-binding GntR family transcriptional regulator